ncbi:MAG TPA: hypothetical protein VEK08_26895 [Planctomycetota bacterium]|nr:hypothetical protein [Planctomycetota bacterium]
MADMSRRFAEQKFSSLSEAYGCGVGHGRVDAQAEREIEKRREELMTRILLSSGMLQTENIQDFSLGEVAKIVRGARAWADLIIETAKEKPAPAEQQTEGGASVSS